MNDNQVNYNQRRIPVVQDLNFFNQPQIKRTFQVALPFINLYQPASTCSSCVLGVSNTVVTLKEGYESFNAGNWTVLGFKVGKVVFLVSSVALTIFKPKIGKILIQAVSLATSVSHFAQHFYEREYRQACKDLALTISSLVYLASIINGAPEWILASVVLQIIQEIGCSYEEFSNRRYLETVAGILMVFIRGYGTREEFFTVKRNWLGKKVDQGQWNQLLTEIQKYKNKDTKNLFDFEKALIEKNLSSRIHKIESQSDDLSQIFFKNIAFKDCNFQKATFKKSVFEKVAFENSLFNEAQFVHSIFRDTIFKGSDLQKTNFYETTSKGLSFLKSNLEHLAFNNSMHKELLIENSQLEGANFLHATVKNSEIKNCDLKNVILANAKNSFNFKGCLEHRFTKPVIALTWHLEYPAGFARLVRKGLEEQGALVMPFEYSPEDIDLNKLDEEVRVKLSNLDENSIFSIADGVVSDVNTESELQKLLQKSLEIARHADGIFLSGGDDVETVFYKKEIPKEFKDYRRTLIEFILLKEVREKDKHLFATCRGNQVTNVYFGGTLKDVGWQFGISELEYVGSAEYVQKIQGIVKQDRLWGYSAHHQAIDKVGKGLVVVAKEGEIPKLVMNSIDKGNIFLTQFHPEYYIQIPQIKEQVGRFYKQLSKSFESVDDLTTLAFLDEYLAQLNNLEIHKHFYKSFLDRVQSQPINLA